MRFLSSRSLLRCSVRSTQGAIPSTIRPVSLGFLLYIRSTPGVGCITPYSFFFLPSNNFSDETTDFDSLSCAFFIVHIGYPVRPHTPCLSPSPVLAFLHAVHYPTPLHLIAHAHFEALCLFKPDLCPMDKPNPFAVRLVSLLVKPSVTSSPPPSLLSLTCIIVCASIDRHWYLYIR